MNKLKFSFTKASGPGGQNVNKTNSKVKMMVDLTGDWLKPEIKRYLELKFSSKINSEASQLLIQSDTHRFQLQNKQLCQEKLETILLEAEKACAPETEPSQVQTAKVQEFKNKFESKRKIEKIKRKDLKSTRNMKNSWKSDDK